ncbi:ANTAR domain-containing protein [Streptomyces sp. NPDC058475]|uniref:ANTAR domain-containing protein n=1 Tax=unclassified Streptomyces TaxID=2593676 RepID=UPI00364AF147
MEELQDENAQLHEAIRSHAVVDQAIGVVLALGRLTPDQGWEVLRAVSQHTNIKLRHVAELIVEWARTGDLCAGIRSELERRIAQCTPPGTPAPEHTGSASARALPPPATGWCARPSPAPPARSAAPSAAPARSPASPAADPGPAGPPSLP